MLSTRVSPPTLEQLIKSLPPGANHDAAEQIRRAYHFAETALAGRRRESGELFVEHDLAVAYIVSELGLDLSTILAALLQSTVRPEVGVKEKDIHYHFGPDVAALVSTVHNLYSYSSNDNYRAKAQTADDAKKEELRRTILTLVEGEIRIILLRMCNILQDLRKASHLPNEKRLEIANEAMNVYAPLANRLGIWQIKWQLEDLAFRYMQPRLYLEIARKIDENQAKRNSKVNRVARKLQARIDEFGLQATVTGRPKHIYSIYRKMERKNVPFNEIYDVQALRAIVDTRHLESDKRKSRKQKDDEARSLCYQVLGAVHSLWQPIPHEFDDYIASPKPNGYRSLHTAVLDDEGQTLEVQIRTDKMDEEAERGIAAHWAYKEGDKQASASTNKRILWFRQLLQNLQEASDSMTDSELLQQEISGERTYVWTPKGDVIDLPAGATPIDFAYHIHTEVGHRCRGAKVNGKMVSLDYRLKSGDKVEIITASRGGPSRDWMNEALGYTASARTRSRIRQWFRQQEREQNIIEGRQIVERELKRLGLADTFTVSDIAGALRFEDEEQFLASVGFGDIQSSQIGGAISALQRKLRPDDELLPLLEPRRKVASGLTVQGVAGLATKLAGCCNPIPPQPIVGYVTRGSGVTIHQADCKTLEQIEEKERLIEVAWGLDQETYPVPIVVRAYHRPGLIEEISNILKSRKINVPKTKKTTANSITTVYMVAEVPSIKELNWLMQRIEKLPNVFEVGRQRWAD